MPSTTAALVLAWIAIVFLAFVCAGIVLELRRLRASLSTPSRTDPSTKDLEIERRATPGPGKGSRLLLLVDEACPVCQDVIPVFVSRSALLDAEVDASLLTSHAWFNGQDEKWPTTCDPELYAHLFPGWLPALVHVTSEGVQSVEPAGSADAIDALVRKIASQRGLPVSSLD